MRPSAEVLASGNWWLSDLNSLINHITERVDAGESVHVVTANIEVLRFADSNPCVFDCLMKAGVLVPDGISAKVLLNRFKRRCGSNIPGIELTQKYLESLKEEKRLFLFGASEETVDSASKHLQRHYGKTVIAGIANGYGFDNQKLIKNINDSRVDILLVALGVPKQELWISNNLSALSKVKLAIGVGGSFDVWSGNIKRAPHWARKMKLEWAYRIMKEPKKRIPRFMKNLWCFVSLWVVAK